MSHYRTAMSTAPGCACFRDARHREALEHDIDELMRPVVSYLGAELLSAGLCEAGLRYAVAALLAGISATVLNSGSGEPGGLAPARDALPGVADQAAEIISLLISRGEVAGHA